MRWQKWTLSLFLVFATFAGKNWQKPANPAKSKECRLLLLMPWMPEGKKMLFIIHRKYRLIGILCYFFIFTLEYMFVLNKYCTSHKPKYYVRTWRIVQNVNLHKKIICGIPSLILNSSTMPLNYPEKTQAHPKICKKINTIFMLAPPPLKSQHATKVQ